MASDSLALSYIPPTIVDGSVVIQLDPTETGKEADKWKHSLIVAVIGEIPRGYYIAKFKEGEDLKEFLYRGPYTISNRPIILKRWSPDAEFDATFLKEIPLWVSFPNLHMIY
uniref:Uncharacterized protein LOC104214842 isoform X2 n=1 Tax=Nicotiana sylvestris TaxID=4096 RepID=A0A1U7VLZ1_NICSY|nr:PREDICTED: uncharacterized protein LOC104214842 isoform X2 [Nicotiana sylvestris]